MRGNSHGQWKAEKERNQIPQATGGGKKGSAEQGQRARQGIVSRWSVWSLM